MGNDRTLVVVGQVKRKVRGRFAKGSGEEVEHGQNNLTTQGYVVRMKGGGEEPEVIDFLSPDRKLQKVGR